MTQTTNNEMVTDDPRDEAQAYTDLDLFRRGGFNGCEVAEAILAVHLTSQPAPSDLVEAVREAFRKIELTGEEVGEIAYNVNRKYDHDLIEVGYVRHIFEQTLFHGSVARKVAAALSHQTSDTPQHPAPVGDVVEALKGSQAILERMLSNWSDETRAQIAVNKAALSATQGQASDTPSTQSDAVRERKPTWWVGSNDEWFNHGPFASRDDALAEGATVAEEDKLNGFYIAEALTREVHFDAARLIEDQYFEDEDSFSYEHGNEPDRLEDSAAADAELQTLLNSWVERHRSTFVRPGLFEWCKSEYIPIRNEAADTGAEA